MKQLRILLLEDALITSLAMGRALEAQIPDCIVMRAPSLYEARLMLRTYDIRLFVVDIQLPDGCGIDFLPEIAERAPSAAVIIVTAMRLPKYRQRAAEYGVLHYMEKPVNVLVLARCAADLLHVTESLSDSSDTSFAASLQNLSAVDVVQLKCLARASVRLDFTRSEGMLGRIYLSGGEVVHAEVIPPSGLGAKEGLDAFNETLSWGGGKVNEVPDAPAPRTTIQGSWQSLMLDACQGIDERRGRNNR
jgi:DNA-binding NarL/FixJ family response regulator